MQKQIHKVPAVCCQQTYQIKWVILANQVSQASMTSLAQNQFLLRADFIIHYGNRMKILNYYMTVSNCKLAYFFQICFLIKKWYKTSKSDENWHSCEKLWKIVTFCVNLLKMVKITYFCHQKWKNSTLIDKNLRTLPVFIRFWCFIPVWNQ